MSCINGRCETGIDVQQSRLMSPDMSRTGPEGEVITTENCENGQCNLNGSGSGGSKASNGMAYARAGCSNGKCGTGGCSTGGCGDQAQKSGCSDGQCGAKKGLFKATMMTVAASELAQLSIDYSQYLS